MAVGDHVELLVDEQGRALAARVDIGVALRDLHVAAGEQGVAALQERITGLGRFGEELREDTAEERFAMFLEDAAANDDPFSVAEGEVSSIFRRSSQ